MQPCGGVWAKTGEMTAAAPGTGLRLQKSGDAYRFLW